MRPSCSSLEGPTENCIMYSNWLPGNTPPTEEYMTTLFLAFDTETTGFPSKKKDLIDSTQPHLVSFSGLQFDTSARILQSTSKVVRSETWGWNDSPSSNDQAFLVHGLSVEFCNSMGRFEKEVLDEILHLWNYKAILVAHNLEFERDIISIAIARYYPKETELLNFWREAPGICTMKANKERVGVKNSRGASKLPNLAETYEHFFNTSITRQHSANADAAAVYQIYCAM